MCFHFEHSYYIPMKWKFYNKITLSAFKREYIQFTNFPHSGISRNVYQAGRTLKVSPENYLNLVCGEHTHTDRNILGRTNKLSTRPL